VHEIGLHERLVGELVFDPPRPLVEDLAGRDAVAARLARIRNLEQADEEISDLAGCFGLAVGPIVLAATSLSVIRARPKSRILTSAPAASEPLAGPVAGVVSRTRMLDGLRSRWMTPRWCA
jgi:hypothetical protein